ncbi:MAG: MFS transporter [Solirubrobacterales bacterium]
MSKSTSTAAAAAGIVLATLAAGQFVMALDTTVMNTAIATVADDLGTTVTGIQTAITLYTLVMASLMITGGKLGEIVGRKRIFTIGCVVYACGSLTTALSQSLPVLIFGWSFLEGFGAVMIMPAIVALVASNFGRPDRPRAPTASWPPPVRSPPLWAQSSAACSPLMPRGGGCSPARS